MSKVSRFAKPPRPRDPQRARDAARGAGHEEVDGRLHRRLRRGEPPVRAQDLEVRAAHAAVDLAAQALDVARHHGADVAVDHGGLGALVLEHLRAHPRRGRDGQAGGHLGRDLRHAPLVGVVGVGVQQGDRQRLHAALEQRLEVAPEPPLVQGLDHRAVGAHPLVRLDRELQGRQRRALVPDDPAPQPPRHEGARDLEHVAVARRGHQPHPRARARQHRVGGHGGPVHDLADLGRPARPPARTPARCRAARPRSCPRGSRAPWPWWCGPSPGRAAAGR